MSSIAGELFTILLFQNGVLLQTRSVDLFLAEVLFFNLTAGTYEVITIHPQVNPSQAQRTVQINPQTAVLGLRFIYSEPERQLLRVETREYRLDG